MAIPYKRCYDGDSKGDSKQMAIPSYYPSGIKYRSPEEEEVQNKRIKVITWNLDEDSFDGYSLSPQKSINLCNESDVSALKYPYLEQLLRAILYANGDSTSQEHLRTNSFIFHIVEELQYYIDFKMKDAKRHNNLKEIILFLHLIYSLLHNNKLPFSFIDKLKDFLLFDLINPASRCNSSVYCYLLQDIIVDIIATLFEKYSSEKLLGDIEVRLDLAFNCTSPFFVQYGAFALSLSSEICMKEFSSMKDDAKEQLCKNAFLAALKNTPSRQSAVNVRDKLLLVFKCWIEHWLRSDSLDCGLSNIKFLTGLNLCSGDFSYFCTDELLQYCILPSKYMCHRIPPKVNTKPFASLSYLIVPSIKELDANFRENFNNYAVFDTKMFVAQEKGSKEEDPIMSSWSDKANLKVSFCGVYLHDDCKIKRNDIMKHFVTNSDDSFLISNSSNPSPDKAIFGENMDCSEEISSVPQPMNEVHPEKKPSVSFEHTSTSVVKLAVSVYPRKDKHFVESAEIF